MKQSLFSSGPTELTHASMACSPSTMQVPDGGLARVRQGISRDPVFAIMPVESGEEMREYLVSVSDTTFRGGDDYYYRLEISTDPHVEAIHPVVAREEESDFSVYGYGLPGGRPVSGRTDGLQVSDLRFAPDFGQSLETENTRGPARTRPLFPDVAVARIETATVRLPDPFSGRVLMTRSAQNTVVDAGGNDKPEHAQHLENLPCDVAGQFFSPSRCRLVSLRRPKGTDVSD